MKVRKTVNKNYVLNNWTLASKEKRNLKNPEKKFRDQAKIFHITTDDRSG